MCTDAEMATNFYRPQTKFGARSYFQKRVSRILLTRERGMPQCMLGYPPTKQAPPGPGTPLPGPGIPSGRGRHPPPGPGIPSGDQAGIPPTRHPPGPGRHPRDRPTPPTEQSMLGDTVNERAVCILLVNYLFFQDTIGGSMDLRRRARNTRLPVQFLLFSCSC